MAKAQIQLTKLLGAEVEEREFMGEMMHYISFPMEINGINIWNNMAFLNLFITPKRANPRHQTHFLSLMYPKELKEYYMKVKELGHYDKALKYVGNVSGENLFKIENRKKDKPIDLDDAFNRE